MLMTGTCNATVLRKHVKAAGGKSKTVHKSLVSSIWCYNLNNTGEALFMQMHLDKKIGMKLPQLKAAGQFVSTGYV
jgi:hypothetical protein